MSKTQFTNYVSKIWAPFLNSIFGTGANGGHAHDGVDADGHCGKIDLSTGANVKGVLPSLMCLAVPLGCVLPYFGSNAPSGYLICNGAAYNPVTYPDLYTLLGVNTLPDLRGRFIIGASSEYAALTTGGESSHTLTVDEMPKHGHVIGQIGSTDPEAQSFYYTSAPSTTGHGSPFSDFPNAASTSGDQSQRHVTQTGESEAHNNLPPYVALVYIIRAL
jgi:microcystin-dependent protein